MPSNDKKNKESLRILKYHTLGFILINGNTADLLNYSYVSLKTLFSNFFEMSTLTNDVFVQDWTVFYWAWWMALSPFVGTFVVNISNGKTLRELILGTVFIGAFGSMLHFLIIGNYRLGRNRLSLGLCFLFGDFDFDLLLLFTGIE